MNNIILIYSILSIVNGRIKIKPPFVFYNFTINNRDIEIDQTVFPIFYEHP